MACRDLKRGEEALQEVKERSGSKNIHLLQLDLSSFKSIRDFSKKYEKDLFFYPKVFKALIL